MKRKKIKCITCGKETDVCYTDEGVLGFTHGHCQCRECYIKSGHPECSTCGELLSSGWKFCAHCGTQIIKVKGGKNG